MPELSLSPLNFRGLLASAGVTPQGDQAPKGRAPNKSPPIECWRCADCLEVYDWEDEAEECCAAPEPAPAAGSSPACPVCSQPAATHRDATDCCLWKDLDAATRWRLADTVEAGSTWVEQLGLAGMHR